MTRVFIHSWHGDFARTEIASEIDYLGRFVAKPPASFRLFACGCGTAGLERIRRPLWLRVVFSFRLYRCCRCGADVFTRRLGRRGYPPL